MKKFSKLGSNRNAMFKNLSNSLIEHGKIQTTLEKAKNLRQYVEPLITRAKHESLHNRRILLSKLFNNEKVVNQLFKVGERNANRNGGYTRIIRLKESNGRVTVQMSIIDYLNENEK
jgi:large subunit ribosomal protein L17